MPDRVGRTKGISVPALPYRADPARKRFRVQHAPGCTANSWAGTCKAGCRWVEVPLEPEPAAPSP